MRMVIKTRKVTEMLEKLSLPVAYDHFAEGESPDPPFICFLYPENMPDFMKLLAKGIKDSKRVLLGTVSDLAGTIGTAFTGLTLPEIGAGQLALAGAGGGTTTHRTVNVGGINVTVNGYNAKNDDDLADTVVHRINEMLNEDGSVWGK